MPYKNPEKKRENAKRRQIHYRQKHREMINEKARQYSRKNLEKMLAHTLLHSAVTEGRVIKPDTCPCGRSNPEGHHEDYSKPLMVVWLCRPCHAKLHH